MLRILQLRLPEAHDEAALIAAVVKMLKIKRPQLRAYKIHKRSIDARKKRHIIFVYSIDVDVDQETAILEKVKQGTVVRVHEQRFLITRQGRKPLGYRPVVVGAGPAGLFAALLLAEAGLNPILFEQGEPVEDRTKTVGAFMTTGAFSAHSNIVFGEGGAGTFSDGKLYTLINDPLTKRVYEELVQAGAPTTLLSSAKPHVGTDQLRSVIQRLRERIISLGGELRFGAQVTDILITDGGVRGVQINGAEISETQACFFAPGAHARDTYEMLMKKGVSLEPKPFSIGVRIEHPQVVINRAQYGVDVPAAHIGPAEYKLVHHERGVPKRTAYTFCMCPGGAVVPAASEAGGVVTNGMSNHARNGMNANSALVVAVSPADFTSDTPLAGMYFQRYWEQKAFAEGGKAFYAPAQRVEDFLLRRPTKSLGAVEPTYKPGIVLADLHACLPAYVCDILHAALPAFDKKIYGFAMPDAILTGIETRTSAPLRILRDKQYRSLIRGLYPIGEGAGYAGGIVSAAIDGMKAVDAFCRTR